MKRSNRRVCLTNSPKMYHQSVEFYRLFYTFHTAFLLLLSPFDGCERVNLLGMFT